MIEEIIVDNKILEQEDVFETEETQLNDNNQEIVVETEEKQVIDEDQEDLFDVEEANNKEIVEADDFCFSNKEKIKFGDVLFDRKVKVFVKLNSEGFITQIDSDVFLKDTTGWTLYDEGDGEKYVYAQSSYFDNSLIDEMGNYRYKF